jgi:hypothetical protein
MSPGRRSPKPLAAAPASGSRSAAKQIGPTHKHQPRAPQAAFALMLAICDGRECLGHVLNRGPSGWEAFDVDDQLLGTFASMREAVRALPQGGGR